KGEGTLCPGSDEGDMSYMSDCRRRSSWTARPAHLPGRPDDVYRRVVSPETRTTPSMITQGDENEASLEDKDDFPPLHAPLPVPGPLFPSSGRLGSPLDTPIKTVRLPNGPVRPRMRSPPSQRRRGGPQGTPPSHDCPYLPSSGGDSLPSGRPISSLGSEDMAILPPLPSASAPPRAIWRPAPLPPSPPA